MNSQNRRLPGGRQIYVKASNQDYYDRIIVISRRKNKYHLNIVKIPTERLFRDYRTGEEKMVLFSPHYNNKGMRVIMSTAELSELGKAIDNILSEGPKE